MIPKRFDQVTKHDVDGLVADRVREGRSIEYKQQLPGRGDDDKKEFLADVSSFANASGGDLLYGVEEARDAAGKPSGVPERTIGIGGINPDQEVLRLEAMIRDGIEPRIPGIQIKPIDGFPNGPVIHIRIPNSWASPHMVTFRASSRFFSRTSAGKAPLDVAEIRAAFIQSEALPEKIRRFRELRIGKIMAGETPLALFANGTIVLHLVPIESFLHAPAVDMRLANDQFLKLQPLYSGGGDKRLNLDGLLTFATDSEGGCIGYAQLFRTGVIETVDCGLLFPEGNGERTIPTVVYEQALIRSVENLMEFQRELGLSTPIVILVTFVGVMNYAMTMSHSPLRRGRDLNRVDRDVLLLPEVVTDDFDCNAGRLLHPVFDAVWQSAGFIGSNNYDEHGNWNGRA